MSIPSREERARRLQQLHGNEADLLVAIHDVTEEITTREWQRDVLVAELQQTRRALAGLLFSRWKQSPRHTEDTP